MNPEGILEYSDPGFSADSNLHHEPISFNTCYFFSGLCGGVLVQPTVGQFDEKPRESISQAVNDSPL